MEEKIYGKGAVTKEELQSSYVPLSGQTMTGAIRVSPGNNSGINGALTNGNTYIKASPPQSAGSFISLIGGGIDGRFYIGPANNGLLYGTPDGHLIWNGGEIVTSKPDIGWFALTRVAPTTGEFMFCCKNGHCFIEGYGFTLTEKSSAQEIASGIPAGYLPTIECKGKMFDERGGNDHSMCWVNGGSQSLWGWCTRWDFESNKGRLFISWPVF